MSSIALFSFTYCLMLSWPQSLFRPFREIQGTHLTTFQKMRIYLPFLLSFPLIFLVPAVSKRILNVFDSSGSNGVSVIDSRKVELKEPLSVGGLIVPKGTKLFSVLGETFGQYTTKAPIKYLGIQWPAKSEILIYKNEVSSIKTVTLPKYRDIEFKGKADFSFYYDQKKLIRTSIRAKDGSRWDGTDWPPGTGFSYEQDLEYVSTEGPAQYLGTDWPPGTDFDMRDGKIFSVGIDHHWNHQGATIHSSSIIYVKDDRPHAIGIFLPHKINSQIYPKGTVLTYSSLEPSNFTPTTFSTTHTDIKVPLPEGSYSEILDEACGKTVILKEDVVFKGRRHLKGSTLFFCGDLEYYDSPVPEETSLNGIKLLPGDRIHFNSLHEPQYVDLNSPRTQKFDIRKGQYSIIKNRFIWAELGQTATINGIKWLPGSRLVFSLNKGILRRAKLVSGQTIGGHVFDTPKIVYFHGQDTVQDELGPDSPEYYWDELL